MGKFSSKILALFFCFTLCGFFQSTALADDPVEAVTEAPKGFGEAAKQSAENVGGKDPGSPVQATYKGRCELAGQPGKVYEKYPQCANSPNECSSNENGLYPLNCLFLTEAIGGKTGYDLYKRVKKENAVESPSTEKENTSSDPCDVNIKNTGDLEEDLASAEADKKACEDQKEAALLGEGEGNEDSNNPENSEQTNSEESGDESGEGADAMDKIKSVTYNYELWYGETLIPGMEQGPYQAILTYEPGKDYQGPLSLLYSYLGLVYNYVSGFILGVVILIAIVGGIEMITSNGNSEQFGKGQGHIINALIGMVIWFLASVILYTINPTFFRF